MFEIYLCRDIIKYAFYFNNRVLGVTTAAVIFIERLNRNIYFIRRFIFYMT